MNEVASRVLAYYERGDEDQRLASAHLLTVARR